MKVEYITLLGVILTFLAATGSWVYTRRNLKTSKYIETITSERIKWLSIIRSEVAELITNIQFAIQKYENDIYDKTLERQNYELSPQEEMEYRIREFGSDIAVGVSEDAVKWGATDYVTKLRLLQLRFNPNEDTKIINSLNFFIELFSGPCVHLEKTAEAKEHINIIIAETQTMLKNEWEKVKKESYGKRDKKKAAK